MGEAKRRKALTRTIPDDVKADIARVVRSINVVIAGGGSCFFRQQAGAIVLHSLAIGLPVEKKFGSMLYRAGPDPQWDVVAFCDRGNAGYIYPHAYLGHAWLESGGDLIDFTVGDWEEQAEGTIALGAKTGADRTDKPINWLAPPLVDFFWQESRGLTKSWRPEGEPPIGQAWYGPLAVRKGEELATRERLQAYIEHAGNLLAPAVPHMLDNLARLRVRERLQASFLE